MDVELSECRDSVVWVSFQDLQPARFQALAALTDGHWLSGFTVRVNDNIRDILPSPRPHTWDDSVHWRKMAVYGLGRVNIISPNFAVVPGHGAVDLARAILREGRDAWVELDLAAPSIVLRIPPNFQALRAGLTNLLLKHVASLPLVMIRRADVEQVSHQALVEVIENLDGPGVAAPDIGALNKSLMLSMQNAHELLVTARLCARYVVAQADADHRRQRVDNYRELLSAGAGAIVSTDELATWARQFTTRIAFIPPGADKAVLEASASTWRPMLLASLLEGQRR